MPIPKPHSDETEEKYISRCISEISSEYTEEGQPYAICKGEWDKPTEMAKIPLDIIGDNEEKILEYLPEPKPHEEEDPYLARCIVVLYPEYYDQTMATALCADKYQRKITVTNMKKQNLSTMKAKPMSDFDRKKLEFQVQLLKKELAEKGIRLAEEGGGSYPWDECIADQTARYGDEETAKKVCGYIKSEYGG